MALYTGMCCTEYKLPAASRGKWMARHHAHKRASALVEGGRWSGGVQCRGVSDVCCIAHRQHRVSRRVLEQTQADASYQPAQQAWQCLVAPSVASTQAGVAVARGVQGCPSTQAGPSHCCAPRRAIQRAVLRNNYYAARRELLKRPKWCVARGRGRQTFPLHWQWHECLESMHAGCGTCPRVSTRRPTRRGGATGKFQVVVRGVQAKVDV